MANSYGLKRFHDRYSVDYKEHANTMPQNDSVTPEKVNHLNDDFDKRHPRDLLIALQSKLAPSKLAHGKQLQLGYHEVLASRERSKSIGEWLQKWQITLMKCIRLSIPETEKYRYVFDTIKGIMTFDHAYSIVMYHRVIEKIDEEKVDIFEEISKFRRYRMDIFGIDDLTIPIKRGDSTGSESQRQQQEEKKKQTQKQKTCVCGGHHGIDKCFYLHLDKMPKGYTHSRKTLFQLADILDTEMKARERAQQSCERVRAEMNAADKVTNNNLRKVES